MNDYTSIERQWILLRTLVVRRHGISIRDMAHEAKVAEKTIRRDLRLFQKLGFPLLESNGERGRKTYRLAHADNVPPLTFAFDEALVIYLARPFLEPLAGTQLWEAAHSALKKIRATLSEAALEYLDQFPRLFHSTDHGFGNYRAKADIIDTLTVAFEDRRAVLLTYQSQHATEPATRDVYPYGLARNKGSLYLVALAVEHEAIRNYKVDRIDAAEITEFVFQRPKDFDMSAYLAGAFGIYAGSGEVTVVVRSLPAVARFVEESRWHASQVLTRERDGSLLARFTLSTTVEVKSWVLGFGANAIVIEPAELRADIAHELEQLIQAYRGQPLKL